MERLDLLNGEFVLVEAPVLLVHRRVRAYHEALLCEVKKKPQYYLAGSDWLLFPPLRWLYQTIANQLVPTFSCDDLDPLSRHSFFIATDPVPNPYNANEQLPGLSRLETLMGYSYPDPPKGKKNSPYETVIVTSGDHALDVLADAVLILKDLALPLAGQLSPADLLKLTKQANDRLRGEEAVQELQRQRDRDVFEGEKSRIEEALKASGVALPEDF